MRGNTGGAVVWGRDVGVVGANGKEAIGILCGVPYTGDKVEGKILRDGLRRKVSSNKILQGAGTQPLQTYLGMRQATVVEWVALRPYLIYAQEGQATRGWGLQLTWWI